MYKTKTTEYGTMYLYTFTVENMEDGGSRSQHSFWGYDESHAADRMSEQWSFEGYEEGRDWRFIGNGKRVKAA